MKFHSRVSLSSYRMKFVWPESILGLNQQRGQAELENRIVLLRVGLEIYESLSKNRAVDGVQEAQFYLEWFIR